VGAVGPQDSESRVIPPTSDQPEPHSRASAIAATAIDSPRFLEIVSTFATRLRSAGMPEARVGGVINTLTPWATNLKSAAAS
jgi:hypothetical protein